MPKVMPYNSKAAAEWRKPYNLKKLWGFALDGYTKEQMAKEIGISPPTFYKWIERYPEIAEATVKQGQSIDREVEQSLLRSALGYEVKEYEIIKDKHGNVIKEIEYQRHIPPSNTAMVFWLKNRRPNEWRDRKEFELSGEVGLVQIIDDISMVEAEADVQKSVIEGESNVTKNVIEGVVVDGSPEASN